MPFQFKLNLDSELSGLLSDYQIIIPSCVLSELKHLKHQEKFGISALKLALTKPQPEWYIDIESKILKPEDNVIDPGDESKTDDLLIQIAKTINGIVVTNDKNLMRQLNDLGVQTISLRAKKYLKLNTFFN